jgi:Zn-finger nucleic acid-binding protein
MRCPTDDTTLQLTERHGIEIDYCPACRGVWLDRGELDKILDRTGDDLASDRRPGRDRDDEPGRHQSEQGRRDDDRYDDHRSDRGRPRKRRSFLDDLFDVG